MLVCFWLVVFLVFACGCGLFDVVVGFGCVVVVLLIYLLWWILAAWLWCFNVLGCVCILGG